MNIAIIGAGFTGLAAGYALTKLDHKVTIFEKDPHPGGLAVGYKEEEWDWTLEKHYHHWFTNDKSVLALAKEVGHPVYSPRPKTSSYVDGGIYQFDSPAALLRFPKLSFIDRIRTGLAIGLLRFNPFWRPLERFTAEPYLKTVMGKTAYKKIWQPLMEHKLGEYASTVSLAWFWSRVYKRTEALVYPEGGFLRFAETLATKIKKQAGEIQFNTEIQNITDADGVKITLRKGKTSQTKVFDKAIVTLPSFLFTKIAPQLPSAYTNSLAKLKGIGAINLILRLKKPFLTDNTYWLNICSLDFPILAIVEHTNFMDKRHYNNEALVYLGNYVPREHRFFTLSDQELFKTYDPYLKKVNPAYKKNLIDFTVFKAPFAQPIIPTNYSKLIPTMTTPLPNVFLANIEQVYPWDRGTNYAVELGQKVASLIIEK